MTNIVEEWVDWAHAQLKDEEAHWISAIKTLAVVEKKIKDLGTKLTEVDRERKSAKVALASAEKQAEDQHQQFRKAEEYCPKADWDSKKKKKLEKKRGVSCLGRAVRLWYWSEEDRGCSKGLGHRSLSRLLSPGMDWGIEPGQSRSFLGFEENIKHLLSSSIANSIDWADIILFHMKDGLLPKVSCENSQLGKYFSFNTW